MMDQSRPKRQAMLKFCARCRYYFRIAPTNPRLEIIWHTNDTILRERI
jgi:hypothetical protein